MEVGFPFSKRSEDCVLVIVRMVTEDCETGITLLVEMMVHVSKFL